MENHPFRIGSVFSEGWRLTKEHLGFLIGFQIIIFLTVLIFSDGERFNVYVYALYSLLGFVLHVLFDMGLYKSVLLIVDNIKPGFDQLYQNWRLFLSWIVASILFGIMVVVGFALLIVPGLYIIGRFGLYQFYILDKNLGPIEALQQTAEASKGHAWHIFLLFLACFGVNIVGALLFGIGLLISIPISLLALGSAYRSLEGQTLQVSEINQ